ncbi:MAG: AI-2E family transporter [Desulfofustis sp.]|nr:AI-2E family transporter [Desulfofustis sp.]
MKRETINTLVVLALVLCISVIFLSMIHQFLMPIFLAGIFSAMLSPVQRWLTAKLRGRQNIASIITIIAIVLLILIPLSILIGIVAAQAVAVGQSVTPFVQRFMEEPSDLTKYVIKLPFYDLILPYRDVLIERAGQVVATVSNFLVNSISSVTKITVQAIFGLIIMLYVMFFFFSMGGKLLNKILYFLPLKDCDEQRLLARFTSVTRATIKGTIVIGLMQGIICGFAFFLADIQGPVFWGTIMAVTSVIPAFGTAIVWIPALIILALTKNYVGVAILAVVCGLISGNLDNLVRPRLVGKDTEMHDLYVLFGTLGGISMFGILGIIVGPIIAALFITIWDIYGDSFKDYLPAVGPPPADAPEPADRNEQQESDGQSNDISQR